MQSPRSPAHLQNNRRTFKQSARQRVQGTRGHRGCWYLCRLCQVSLLDLQHKEVGDCGASWQLCPGRTAPRPPITASCLGCSWLQQKRSSPLSSYLLFLLVVSQHVPLTHPWPSPGLSWCCCLSGTFLAYPVSSGTFPFHIQICSQADPVASPPQAFLSDCLPHLWFWVLKE